MTFSVRENVHAMIGVGTFFHIESSALRDNVLASCWIWFTCQGIEQSGLAGPRGAHDGEHFPGLREPGDAMQHRLMLPLVIGNRHPQIRPRQASAVARLPVAKLFSVQWSASTGRSCTHPRRRRRRARQGRRPSGAGPPRRSSVAAMIHHHRSQTKLPIELDSDLPPDLRLYKMSNDG